MATTKKATKKGIVLTKSSTGIVVSIYAGNGRHLFRASGYNNVPNSMKGTRALRDILMAPWEITDLTKKKPAAKKAAPKKKA